MAPQAEGSYFRPKHLQQTISSYFHIIETGSAKPRQHYLKGPDEGLDFDFG